MNKLSEASIKRLVYLRHHWFRFYDGADLIVALGQARLSNVFLLSEGLHDMSVKVDGDDIFVKDLAEEVFDKIEGELLKRIGAAVNEQDEVILVRFDEDDDEYPQRPHVSLQWETSASGLSAQVQVKEEVD